MLSGLSGYIKGVKNAFHGTVSLPSSRFIDNLRPLQLNQPWARSELEIEKLKK